ncbi:hypothetical protein O0L34_g13281 [Tuta absoluta]|nr:hypothetical protein O0L34_g13281 [Tuta absoluta]
MSNGGLTAGLAALTGGGFPALSNAGMTAVANSGSNVPNSGLAALSALASFPGLLQALTSMTATTQPATASAGVPTLQPQYLQAFESSTSAPSVPTCKQNKCPATTTQNGGLDAGVLNNLAIALQLLIVSNILNANLPENEANPIYELLETAKSIPLSFSQTETPVTQSEKSNNYASQQSNIYPSSSASYASGQTNSYSSSSLPSFEELMRTYSEPSYPPNSNFVGTSGFTDFSVSDPYIKPSPRNSVQLMSPYEALGPNSPFSDPIIGSAYGSVMSSKRDFVSPYIMMDSDPFASDLFS